ncbi:hypothetical protein HF086_014520 [Spodoptera exigua]|uniref:Beta-1,4-glucuronyltransferase 1 n=1 Tax=Spodoptera exigua TaxID=7107 RepID=A0A922MYR0_SPOEX|nr:hypothetical protein HF086_014520 [Spodoptera exigua]
MGIRNKGRDWRFQWSMVMIAAAALVAYNAVANLGCCILLPAPFHLRARRTEPPTCEPCFGKVSSAGADYDPIYALDPRLGSSPKCPLCAYVVPTYELDRRVAKFPANKSELVRLSRSKLAIPFHRKVFIYNQFASNFSRWEASGGNESELTHISHNVTNFELLYEPFYLASDIVPAHDERFLGYGFTRTRRMISVCCSNKVLRKVNVVYEMFLIGYQFKVLSPIFTIHWGIQTRRNRPLWREKQNENNRKHFETFKKELFARYRKDPLHLLKRPQQAKKT